MSCKAIRETLGSLAVAAARSNKPGDQPFGQGDVGKKCPRTRALTQKRLLQTRKNREGSLLRLRSASLPRSRIARRSMRALAHGLLGWPR